MTEQGKDWTCTLTIMAKQQGELCIVDGEVVVKWGRRGLVRRMLWGSCGGIVIWGVGGIRVLSCFF